MHAPAQRSWFDLFAAWQDALSAQVAERTRDHYGNQLIRFIARVRMDPATVGREDLEHFLRLVPGKGPARESYKAAFKSYFGWAYEEGHYRADPAARLRYKAPKYAPAVSLELEEYRRVILAASMRRPYPRRAWTLILGLETGARIGSLAAVTPDDAPTEAGRYLRFRVAKGDRPYSVPLTPLAAMAVRELLPQSNGTLIARSANTIWDWYHTAAVEAGLPRNKQGTHRLRDSFATNLLEAGESPRVVQELLNHADLSQMKRYWAVTDPRKRRVMRQPVSERFPAE